MTTSADAAGLNAGADVCPNCDASRASEYCQSCRQRRTRPEHLTVTYYLNVITAVGTMFAMGVAYAVVYMSFKH